ncbi:MAG: IS66 family transposase, partial [Pseudomonadota bacterium]
MEQRLLAYENAHTPPSKQQKKSQKRPPSGNLGAPIGHPRYERPDPEPTGSKEYIEDTCPHCQTALGAPVKTERILEEEIPEPQPIEVIEHLVNHYKCPCCKKHIVATNNAPKGRFGKNVQAHISLLKYDDRLPLRKVVASVERHYKLTLSDVSVLNITQRVAGKLQAPYQALIKRVRKSRVVYADETKLRVEGRTYWLWTFVTELETLFVIRQSRSKKVVEEILGPAFTGIICCDGWNAYAQFTSNIQRCWAHILREAEKLAENHAEFEGFEQQFKELFARIKTIRGAPPPPEAREALVVELKNQLQQLIEQMNAYTHFRKFATKVTNGMDYWFTCVRHLFVEPTNNTAERALRELVVQRKIIGGLRRESGADTMQT